MAHSSPFAVVSSPSLLLLLSTTLLCLPAPGLAGLVTHDSSFVPDHVLHVSAKNISNACDERYSAVVNGTSPGPAIRLRPGGSSWIRVYNDMPDANLTMHWHGISQRMAQFSDGSVLASQWPIPPLHFYDYEVEAFSEDSGTYFYHSHIGMQALTAHGPLIVEDCALPPYHFDDERTFLFHEHYQQDDKTFEEGLIAAPLRFGGELQAVMLNGQGIAVNHTPGEIPGDFSCQLPVVHIDPGKTYRFRFIGATSLGHTLVAFEAHDHFDVIAVDGGQYTKPAAVDRIQIGSGQRFDVRFRAKTAAELDALGTTDFYIQFESRDRPAVYRGFGLLRYNAKLNAKANKANNNLLNDVKATAQAAKRAADWTVPLPAPHPLISLPNDTYDWLENTLESLQPDPDFPTLAEVTRRITIDSVQLTSADTGQIIWQLNGLNWNEYVAHQVPLLVDIYQRGDAAVPNFATAVANRGWDPALKAYAARVGEVLEIVLQNTGSLVVNGGGVDIHPFHAHGQHYYDLGSGNGTYDPIAVDAARRAANYTPVKRDTTMLYRYEVKTTAGAHAGWRAWRFRVDQPGVWVLHCHTLQHMMMGMQSVWVVGNASEIRQTPTELSQGYFTYGGDVYGNETHDPRVYEHFKHQVTVCPVP